MAVEGSASAAVVLHRRPWRERDLLLDCFSADAGRLRLLARGAATGERSALLQPAIPLLLSWRGQRELKTLTAVEAGEGRALALSAEQLWLTYYLHELLLRLLPLEVPLPLLFHHYWQTLQRLSGGEAVEWPLRQFEAALLAELGVEWLFDGEGHRVEAQRYYRYDGVALWPVAGARARGGVTVEGRWIAALAQSQRPPASGLAELKRFMRQVIDHWLDGRPLRSRLLYRQMVVRQGIRDRATEC
ncbi:DNA repair protein RecO [Ectothiorhodospiraceae bacterium BW-2]|nr:DNA repair protein RecO [Ectothiorhodospiraceae bacterium BW-2]